ncbi:hypothetical protein [Puniceibacterium confluentis]|nr:hypothetical protein [Puniceibacterium confluentis]
MRAALILSLLPMAAPADVLECRLFPEGGGAELLVAFGIDRTQFAPPLNPDEPPRRQESRVAMGDETFAAEPLLFDDGRRGFWTGDRQDGALLMMIAPDSRATLSTQDGAVFTGDCEDLQ